MTTVYKKVISKFVIISVKNPSVVSKFDDIFLQLEFILDAHQKRLAKTKILKTKISKNFKNFDYNIFAKGCEALRNQNFVGPYKWRTQCRVETPALWSRRFGESVCRQCFSTCDAVNNPGACLR